VVSVPWLAHSMLDGQNDVNATAMLLHMAEYGTKLASFLIDDYTFKCNLTV